MTNRSIQNQERLRHIEASQTPFKSPDVRVHVVHVGPSPEALFSLRDAARPSPERLQVLVNGMPVKVASDDGETVTLVEPAPAESTVVFADKNAPVSVTTLALPNASSFLAMRLADQPVSDVMSKRTIRVDL